MNVHKRKVEWDGEWAVYRLAPKRQKRYKSYYSKCLLRKILLHLKYKTIKYVRKKRIQRTKNKTNNCNLLHK